MPNLPAISGNQLIKLLKGDGWKERRIKGSHMSLAKDVDGKNRTAVVICNNKSIPEGTLHEVLGVKQTGLGRNWLVEQTTKQRKTKS